MTSTIRALFARAIDALERAFADEGRSVVFHVFLMHDVSPAPGTSYASVARNLHLTSSQVTNYLHAARRRFRETTLASLRSMTGTDEEFRQEARELFGLEVGA